MKTFEEIEKIAIGRMPEPEYPNMAEKQCIIAMRYLCKEYIQKTITKEDAAKQKLSIKAAYQEAIYQDERHKSVYAYYQDNIRHASTLRTDIRRAKTTKDIALLACECIGRMCGEMSDYKNIKQKIEDGEVE